ncbi:hypothetical protein RHGRI_013299 [Rhododendron griersonianum]|uniref:Uncharacterized protein n=1 Tax=Rhododendron griersonianum TaxID=479676 RepID=A0AAV6K532_9ERIC|nr:hypothetical protein RHGRI_013299 [Rhododendron griersonianum]
MDSSPSRSKSNCSHTRSTSLPSRLHPLIPHVDENSRHNGLRILFERLDNMLLLPRTQQAFAQQRHQLLVEEVLEKYIRLLDICAAAKDVSTLTKQDVQNLLSILRRRRDTNDFAGYLTSRKKAKKAIQKSLKDLKSIKSKSTTTAFENTHEISSLLNEVEAAMIGVFESSLSYIAGAKVESRVSGFSLVSKLMNRKSIAPEEEETKTDAFEIFDAALHSLNSHKTSKADLDEVDKEIVERGLMEGSKGKENITVVLFPYSHLERNMSSSPLRSKSNYHARSVSCPSRPHPFIPHVDESLRLSGLQNMFDRLDDLLLLPHTQQAFAQQRHGTWAEEVLEKYLRLLDICAAAKGVSTQTKQDVQNLLSILRRRRDTNDFAGYVSSRKKAKKMIQKSLKDLKSIKYLKSVKSNTTIVPFEKSLEISEIISLLNEVEAATVGEFESLLSYIAGKKVESRVSGFSLVSKLMHRKSIASNEEETNSNAFENFDDALCSLNSHSHKTHGVIHMENVQNQLGKMESSIQDIEEGLECMFRRLIRARVSLLNILNY